MTLRGAQFFVQTLGKPLSLINNLGRGGVLLGPINLNHDST